MKRIEKAIVLTPEHVEIQLTPAGLGRRFTAWLIDLLVQLLAIVVLAFAVGLAFAFFPGVGQAVLMTVVFLVWWGYPIWFEVRREGRTIGKKAMSIRVVDRRGLPLTFLQSLVRNVARVIDAAPVGYGVGILASLCDKHHRRLGDLVADTLVIVDRQPLRSVERLSFKDDAGSLSSPKIRQRIRHRIGLDEREFLLALCLRANRMNEAARYDLMESVGDHFRRKIGIEDAHLSGERVVRGIAAVLFRREEDA